MSAATRPIGLAQLSLLDTAPPDLVLIAAEAGFDFIGARVRPVTPAERPYDLGPGTAMLRRTQAAVRETGVGIRDIEFLLLDGTDQRDAWLSMMAAGQALGAVSLTVACADPDLQRAADTLGRMVEDGRDHGIVPTLEPISYQAVHSLPDAARLARQSGCRIVADALHLHRFGATLEELAACAQLVPLLQLCDGPAQRPAAREQLVRESRSDRLIPGHGDIDLAGLVRALPDWLALSVETPSQRGLAELGATGWAHRLRRAVEGVLSPTVTGRR